MTAPTFEQIAPEALIDRPARAARATLRDGVVGEYASQIRDGATFPAVVAFTDGANYWLADGRHRVEAHRAARPGEPMDVEIHQGDELAALRYALAANAHHGARRSGDDLRAAFAAAVKARLVDPADAAVVAAALGCSTATAYRLTEPARIAAKAKRDAEIQARRDAGESQRAVARTVGVGKGTVSRVVRNSHEKNASGPASAPSTEGEKTDSPPPPSQPPASFEVMMETGAAQIDAALASVRDLAPLDLRKALAALNDRQLREFQVASDRAGKILARVAAAIQAEGTKR